jgi:hypothetical protein
VLRVVCAFAVLMVLGVTWTALSPHATPVYAFPNVVAVTVDSSGVVTVRYQVTSNAGLATLDAQLSGGSGAFISANAVVGPGGTSCVPDGIGSRTLSYPCLNFGGTGSVTLAETTAIFQCTSSSQVSFRLTQGSDVRTSASVPCGTSSSSSSPLFVTATPNVVPCGGRTLITANLRDLTGSIVPNTVVHFETDQGLLDPSGINTAVLTVYPGMSSARVRASASTANGVQIGEVLVQVFCPTPTALGPNGYNSLGTPIAAQPAAATSITLTANPGAVERCGGTVFVVASIKDSSGRPAADGTTVLFIASGGTISTDSATTVAGTTTITFTADRNMTGSVKISGQAGVAFASVNIPIACTATEAIRAVAGTPVRPSSSTTSTDSSAANGTESTGSSLIPPPLSSVPNFTPPRTGDTRDLSSLIRPPSTGEAGLATGW